MSGWGGKGHECSWLRGLLAGVARRGIRCVGPWAQPAREIWRARARERADAAVHAARRAAAVYVAIDRSFVETCQSRAVV